MTETISLAGPLAMGHLSHLAMSTATLVMFGWIGSDVLAAGGLAIRVAVSTNILAGILLVVGVAVSEARGAGASGGVASLYWNGLYLTLALSLLSFGWMTVAPGLLLALGQPPEIVAETERCLDVMRWAEAANILRLGLMRSILPVLGMAWILYALTPIGLALYTALGLSLVNGWAGLPEMGWIGVPIALVITNALTAVAMLSAVHLGPARRQVPFTGFDPAPLRTTLKAGFPIGVMQGVDGIYYLVITLVIGQFGAPALAAHQIALNFGGVAYALAASCGDAAALRIAFRRGARAYGEARTAGLVGIVLGVTSMGSVGVLLYVMPDPFIGVFMDLSDPANAETLAITRSLLLLSALFIIADGFYGTGMGVLRGHNDNRYAMKIVVCTYWGLGLPLGFLLSMGLGLEVVGIWCGLVAGPVTVGAFLMMRYNRLSLANLPSGAATEPRRLAEVG